MRRTAFKITLSLMTVLALAACDGKVNTAAYGIADIEQDEWAYDQDSYGGDEVYVCTGGSSKKYHSTPDCRYLENCKSDIREVDRRFAEEKGRTPCKKCYDI